MDDLRDINLQFDDQLSKEDIEVYACMENEFTSCGAEVDMSRPSSTVSFASWTFSPITEDLSVISHDATSPKQETQEEPTTTSKEPAHSNDVHLGSNPMVPEQHPQAPCQFLKSNTITYHHSVNIHNYLGNPCMGTPSWKKELLWGRPVPADTRFVDRPETPHQVDPLLTINTVGLEFTRCSTPEYLMALNSLNQFESPPRPNHSAAFNCTPSFEESVNKHDSGYSSDQNFSPVIQFQDSNISSHCKSTADPTPPPLRRFTQMPEINKENIAPTAVNRFIPSPFAMPVNGLTVPRTQCSEIVPNILMQTGGYLQSTLKEPESVQTLLSQAGPKFTSIADHQKIKRQKSESVKRKAEQSQEDDNDSKRRRHNEPLNNTALQIMNDWYEAHADNPYPSKAEKDELARQGGISLAQVKSWFANKRNRSHNTRPKKQKKEMECRLLDLCHQLARDASRPDKDNAYYIQQLSSILDRNKFC